MKPELDILYEDSDVIVVNKPKNMVVHPAAGHYTGTLVNAVMYHCKDNLSLVLVIVKTQKMPRDRQNRGANTH